MMKVTITTVERTAFEADDVTELVVPTEDGVITVLPEHVQLVSLLSMGELEIHFEKKDPLVMFIDGGVLEIDQEGGETYVNLLTDLAEKADELDAAKIEEAKRRAEKLLEEKPLDVDLAKVEASLQRELARLKLIERYKPR